MNFVQSTTLALKAELLKQKRSGTFWLCFGAALFIPLLTTAVFFFVDDIPTPTSNAWDGYIENIVRSFTGFFYPIFLVLMMVRLVYLEHRSDTWKLMETQPISRASLYLAKWKIAVSASLLCLLLLFAFSLAGGLFLQTFKPAFKFQHYSPAWERHLGALLRYWIGGLAILSVQYFLGLWMKSFAWPMAIGLVATIAGSIFAGFGVLTWWPYAAPGHTSSSYGGNAAGGFLMHHEKLGLLWAFFFLWLGYRLFIGRNLRFALFRPRKQLAFSLAAFALFITLSWFINRPAVLNRYGKTVLAGQILSDKPVSRIELYRELDLDTVMVLPVQKGRFHLRTDKELEPGIYYLRAGSYRTPIYFGAKDSLYVELTLQGRTQEVHIKGSRMAENAFLKKQGSDDYWHLTNFAYNYKPAEYAGQVLDAWKEDLKTLEEFKTMENIKPAEDFMAAQRKLIAFRLLSLVDFHYPRIFGVYHPNEKLQYPASLETLRKAVSLNDPSLAPYSDFRDYLAQGIRARSGRNDSLYFHLLQSGVNEPAIRNALLFEGAESWVFRTRDTVRRAALFQQVIAQVSDDRLRKNLLGKYQRLQNLQRGQKAPPFAAESITAASYDMGQLTERYLVVDVWATWCGPCKREAPYFEELAERYTSEDVAFVSVSIDEDKNAWRMEASAKNSRVLQLWAANAEQDFQHALSVSSIPRFMLIGPKGTIINADMPAPSDPEFEAILQREIPVLSR